MSNLKANFNDEDVVFSTINILVVCSKIKFLAVGGSVLHSNSHFKVTIVDDKNSALKLLCIMKTKFDLLLVDRNMSGMDVHSFLNIVNDFDLLSIVMSDQEDDEFEFRALESGAHFTITTPITTDVITLLRQSVVRKRTLEYEKYQNGNSAPKDVRDPMKLKLPNMDERNKLKKKVRFEWTKQLHDKFKSAMNQIGDETKNCLPQRILELMDVPGLTRAHISSHLQHLKKKKNHHLVTSSSRNHLLSSSIPSRKSNEQNFSHTSSLQAFESDQECNRTLNGVNPPVNGLQTAGVNCIAQPTKCTPLSLRDDLGTNQHEAGFGSTIATTINQNPLQGISNVHDAQPGSDQDPILQDQTPSFDDFLIYFNDDAQFSEYFLFRNDNVMQNKDTNWRNKHN